MLHGRNPYYFVQLKIVFQEIAENNVPSSVADNPITENMIYSYEILQRDSHGLVYFMSKLARSTLIVELMPLYPFLLDHQLHGLTILSCRYYENHL